MKVSTLSQNGRNVDGMLSFEELEPRGVTFVTFGGLPDDEPLRVRVGLARYALDFECGESSFELNMQGQRKMTFRGTPERYEYHPATGLHALILLSGEPEYEDITP